MRRIKSAAGTTLALTLLLLPAACNTVEGLGEDLRAAGEGAQRLVAPEEDQPKTASTNDGAAER